MKIKNYIVDNIDIVIETIERELCIKGISYVRIENEFHFNNQIIRLYDLELHRRIIFAWLLNKEFEVLDSSLEESILNLSRSFVENYAPPLCEFDFLKEEKTYQPRRKNNYKQESKRVNQLLKKYKR